MGYYALYNNSLLYEAVAAPCTSLAQSSAGTTVKVSLDIPAAPHTTSYLILRLPYFIVEIQLTVGTVVSILALDDLGLQADTL